MRKLTKERRQEIINFMLKDESIDDRKALTPIYKKFKDSELEMLMLKFRHRKAK